MTRKNKARSITHSAIAALAAMLIAGVASAESRLATKPIDWTRVQKVTQNPASRYYYPNLVKLYQSNTDTTMQLEDYRDLYYGYIFQEDYDPYRQSVYADHVEQLYYKKPQSRAECDSIEKYAELSLNDNMFDFDQMQYYIFVLKEKKKYARSAVRSNKLERLIAAIMSSGKGTKEQPWVVICPQHEYDIVNLLGYVATDHQEMEDGIDYLKVKHKDGSKVEGFYFDVKRMLAEAKRKGYDQ